MKKKNRFPVFAVCALLMFMSGCGSEAGTLAEKIRSESGVKATLGPGKRNEQAASDMLRNTSGSLLTAEKGPLIFTAVYPVTGNGSYYPTVTGIADDAILSTVNSRIETVFKSASLDASAAETDVTCVDCMFSCNDFLSFRITRTNAAGQLTCTSGLNMDLRNIGEVILPQLIKDASEYKDIIGSVDELTEYYLSEDGLNIIGEDLSVKTYGFDTFEGSWTIAGGCEASLYSEPDSINSVLLSQGGLLQSAFYQDYNFGLDNIYVSFAVEAPEGYPQALIDSAKSLLSGRQVSKENTIALARKNRGEWITCTNKVVCRQFGDYYVLTAEYNDNLNEKLEWSTKITSEVYDAGFNKLSIENIFSEGFEYRDYIKDEILDYLVKTYGENASCVLSGGSSAGVSGETAYKLFDGGSLALYSEGIVFNTLSLKVGDSADYCSPVSVTVPYNKIGKNNLNIL